MKAIGTLINFLQLFGLWLRYRAHLCLFDAIVELHAMDEKMFHDFFIEN